MLDVCPPTRHYDSLDQFGRTIKTSWGNGAPAAPVDEFTYSYDFASNLTSRVSTQDTSRNRFYDYDGLNQLQSSEESGTDNDRFFRRDQVGNLNEIFSVATDSTSSIAIETRTHNLANEFENSNARANPEHDAAGNMTVIPKPRDPATSFAGKYDAWNRLVSLDGSTYGYDGLNRRIIRTEPGTTKEFYYNTSSQVLTETDSSDNVTAIYAYHPQYVDAVAVRIRPNDEHFFTHDNQYSVTSAINRNGNVDERYRYSPYGETTVLDSGYNPKTNNASSIDNEYTYTGRRLDPSGLMYFRARYYDPNTGQFISRDPLGYVDGMSQYRAYFVPGGVDPWGLTWKGPQWHHIIPKSWLGDIAVTYASELKQMYPNLTPKQAALRWLNRSNNGWVISGSYHSTIHNKLKWNSHLWNAIPEWPGTLTELEQAARKEAFDNATFSGTYGKGGPASHSYSQWGGQSYWQKRTILASAKKSMVIILDKKPKTQRLGTCIGNHSSRAGKVVGALTLLGVAIQPSVGMANMASGNCDNKIRMLETKVAKYRRTFDIADCQDAAAAFGDVMKCAGVDDGTIANYAGIVSCEPK